MKTNSRIKKQKKSARTTAEIAPRTTSIPQSGNMEPLFGAPDYSSMHKAVEMIKDPVSFEDLKKFYRIA